MMIDHKKAQSERIIKSKIARAKALLIAAEALFDAYSLDKADAVLIDIAEMLKAGEE